MRVQQAPHSPPKVALQEGFSSLKRLRAWSSRGPFCGVATLRTWAVSASRRTFTAYPQSSPRHSAAPGDGRELFSSGCGGRRPSRPLRPQPRGPPRCGRQARGGLSRPRPESIDVRRGGALTATDTLSVAWLRGGFGRDAGASSAGFRDWIDRLDDVFTDAQPSGVSPPRARALSRECYAYHIWLSLGRFSDDSKDSCMSLFNPFANCKTRETMTVLG